MAKTRLTRLSKVLITLAIVAAILFGGKLLLENTSLGDKLEEATAEIELEKEKKQKEKEAKQLAKEEEERLKEIAREQAERNKPAIRVQLYDSGNAFPGIYFNKGWKPNDDSRFLSEFGFKVEFVLFDNLDKAIEAWKRDEFDLLIHSVDEIPSFIEGMESENPQIIMQLDWSRGDVAILANKRFETVNDLENQKVSFRRGSGAETFMHRALEASGMSTRNIQFTGVTSNEDAFSNNTSGASQAFIIQTNQAEKLAIQMNCNVLQTTEQASHVVARTFVAKKKFIDAKKEVLNKFYKGWMMAVSEIQNDPNALESAAHLYAEEMPYTENEAIAILKKVRLASHGDNMNFFKKNKNFTGLVGEDIYKEMGKIYGKIGLAPNARPRWKTLTYLGAIESGDEVLTGAKFEAERPKGFSLAMEDIMQSDPVSVKSLSINFSPGKSKLSESAKSFIDVRISDLLMTYNNTRIRIEGNVSESNDPQVDLTLSQERARAVMSYLIERYDFDPNRFLVKGNGSTNPVKGCEQLNSDACKAKNRRIEFMFLKN